MLYMYSNCASSSSSKTSSPLLLLFLAWVSVVITVLASIALWWLELTDLLAWTPVQIVTNVAFLSIFVCSVMRSLLAGQRTLGDNVTLLLSLPLFLLLGCFLWV